MRMRAVMFVVLGIAVITAGCGTTGVKGRMDQSTPKAGFAAFLDAMESGKAGRLRQCVYVRPEHKRFGDDWAMMSAASARLALACCRHFPGQRFDDGAPWDKQFANARHSLTRAIVTIAGDEATVEMPMNAFNFLYYGTVPATDDGWGRRTALRKEGPMWKVSLEFPKGSTLGLPDIDNYPPRAGSGDEAMAQIYLGAYVAPVIFSLAADIEAGKFKTVEDVVAAMDERMNGKDKEFMEALAREEVNRGNPATRPTKDE